MTRRVALVTGGTRGIGFAIAAALVRESFDLVLCGTRAEHAAQAALDELRSAGGAVAYLQADVAVGRDREQLVASTLERFGALHVLVNNAGVAPLVRGDLLEAGEESFDRVMGVNLKGPQFLTQAVARVMLERKRSDPSWRGCVVFVTSVSATMVSTDRGEYCISKAGLAMSARLWAVRLAAEAIPVYEVRPGIIHTDMTAAAAARYDRRIEDGLVPERRWGEPEDVGRLVAALVRGDAGYSTGAVITVDGGLAIPRL